MIPELVHQRKQSYALLQHDTEAGQIPEDICSATLSLTIREYRHKNLKPSQSSVKLNMLPGQNQSLKQHERKDSHNLQSEYISAVNLKKHPLCSSPVWPVYLKQVQVVSLHPPQFSIACLANSFTSNYCWCLHTSGSGPVGWNPHWELQEQSICHTKPFNQSQCRRLSIFPITRPNTAIKKCVNAIRSLNTNRCISCNFRGHDDIFSSSSLHPIPDICGA